MSNSAFQGKFLFLGIKPMNFVLLAQRSSNETNGSLAKKLNVWFLRLNTLFFLNLHAEVNTEVLRIIDIKDVQHLSQKCDVQNDAW